MTFFERGANSAPLVILVYTLVKWCIKRENRWGKENFDVSAYYGVSVKQNSEEIYPLERIRGSRRREKGENFVGSLVVLLLVARCDFGT
mgnify:CR=1 FL=1